MMTQGQEEAGAATLVRAGLGAATTGCPFSSLWQQQQQQQQQQPYVGSSVFPHVSSYGSLLNNGGEAATTYASSASSSQLSVQTGIRRVDSTVSDGRGGADSGSQSGHAVASAASAAAAASASAAAASPSKSAAVASTSAAEPGRTAGGVFQAWTLRPPQGDAAAARLSRRALRRLGRGWTLAEVARHNTAEDGWIAVNGRVYDITEHVLTHPGWAGAGVSTVLSILAHLGSDCSAEFEEIHRPWPVAWKQLAAFDIGPLVQGSSADSSGCNSS